MQPQFRPIPGLIRLIWLLSLPGFHFILRRFVSSGQAPGVGLSFILLSTSDSMLEPQFCPQTLAHLSDWVGFFRGVSVSRFVAFSFQGPGFGGGLGEPRLPWSGSVGQVDGGV